MRATSNYLQTIKYKKLFNGANIGGTTPSLAADSIFLDKIKIELLESRQSKSIEDISNIITKLAKLKSENILFTPGASQAVFQAMAGLAEENDGVCFLKPTYEPFCQAANFLKLKVRQIELEDLMSSKRFLEKVVVITNPNFFRGNLIDNLIIQRMSKKFKYIIVDEIYYPLLQKEFTSANIFDLDKFIFIGGLSKISGYSSPRVGWVFSSRKNLNKIERIGLHLHVDMPTCSLQMGFLILKNISKVIRDIQSQIKLNRSFLKELDTEFNTSLRGLEKFHFTAIKIPDKYIIGGSFNFCKLLAKRHNFFPIPGSFFGASDEIRISLLSRDKKFKDYILTLQEYYRA